MTGNIVEIDWPPRSGKKLTVPKTYEVWWFGLDDARRNILPSQAPLLDRLASALARQPPSGV